MPFSFGPVLETQVFREGARHAGNRRRDNVHQSHPQVSPFLPWQSRQLEGEMPGSEDRPQAGEERGLRPAEEPRWMERTRQAARAGIEATAARAGGTKS